MRRQRRGHIPRGGVMKNPKDPGHRDNGIRTAIACPHCGSATRTRTSRRVTSTYRQLNLVCTDPECGATFGAELAITHAISPSARPNAAVHLRSAPPRRRSPANDDAEVGSQDGPGVPSRAANDDDVIGHATG